MAAILASCSALILPSSSSSLSSPPPSLRSAFKGLSLKVCTVPLRPLSSTHSAPLPIVSHKGYKIKTHHVSLFLFFCFVMFLELYIHWKGCLLKQSKLLLNSACDYKYLRWGLPIIYNNVFEAWFAECYVRMFRGMRVSMIREILLKSCLHGCNWTFLPEHYQATRKYI